MVGTFVQAAPAASYSPLHQLPSAPDLTGRDDELRALEALLTAPHAAGATISSARASLQGMGGVGKTALATVLAHRLTARYPDAQLFLDLRGADPQQRAPVDPREAMERIVLTFRPGAKLPEFIEQVAPFYLSVLRDAGRVLLVLDNAAGRDQVRPLLPPENCLLLVTSRAHFELPGLATRNLDCLAPEKSCELLLRLAPRLRGGESEAAELCGHLPLALEVFAGAVNDRKLAPVPELLARLRAGTDRLAPVDAAFEVSSAQLVEETRRAWLLLAVFSASFDLPAAAAVWEKAIDAARDTMEVLMHASLVEWNEAVARFRLHDLARQFCDSRLADEARHAALRRYINHYGGLAWQIHEHCSTGGKGIVRGLEIFDRERVHIGTAFTRLVARADDESSGLLISIVCAVEHIGDLRFRPREHISWLEAELEAARRISHEPTVADALGKLGNVYAALSKPAQAAEHFEQQLHSFRKEGSSRGEVLALSSLCRVYAMLGDERRAIACHESAMDIVRGLGDRQSECRALGNLGLAYSVLDDLSSAIRCYEKQLEIAREIGHRAGEGDALSNLGVACMKLGHPNKAVKLYQYALDIAREVGNQRIEVNALSNLGIAYRSLKELDTALDLFQRALVIDREIGDRRGEGNGLWNSALALNMRGDRAQAIAHAKAALPIFEDIEDPSQTKVRAALDKWLGEEPPA